MAYTIKTWEDGNRVYAVDINKWEKGIDDVHKEKLDKTSYTATDVLTKVKTVDGAGSGLDADLLDGQQGTYYASASALASGLAQKLNSSAYTANDVLTKLLTVDGNGSRIDADLLDGKHASSFALTSHSHAWSTITGKPSTFSPSAHNHVWEDITGTLPVYATRWPRWSEVTNKPSTFTPSAHTHAWADITDKPTTFTPSAHNQDWSTITSKPATATRWPAWGEVTGKPSTFAPSSHTHSYSQITGDIPFITYGTSVPTSLPIRHIFIKI